jgi:hypothetical protein
MPKIVELSESLVFLLTTAWEKPFAYGVTALSRVLLDSPLASAQMELGKSLARNLEQSSAY